MRLLAAALFLFYQPLARSDEQAGDLHPVMKALPFG